MSTERPYHFDHLLQVLKKSHWSPILYIFSNVFVHVYSPRSGADNPLVTKFLRQQKAQITLTICCKFQMISLNSDFIHIFVFNYFIHVNSPGQTNPWGQNFDVNEKLLPLRPFVQVSKKSLWILILYTSFNVFPHVYRTGAGADNPLWKKFWCQQKGIVTLPICCKFKKNIFEVSFYIYLCLFLYMYIAWGQGQTQPPGVRILF